MLLMSSSSLLRECKKNENERKDFKRFSDSWKYLGNKISSSLFSEPCAGRERSSFLNCCVPSRSPELIHLDTESENIPNPFYTQAAADKTTRTICLHFVDPKTSIYTNIWCFKDMLKTSLTWFACLTDSLAFLLPSN